MINSFTRDNELLLAQLMSILYWFRGAYSRDDVFQLTPYERDEAVTFLNKRFEDAGEMIKKQVPVFV